MRLSFGEIFGIRSMGQITSDMGEVVRDYLGRRRFQFDVRSAGLLRPALSVPTYLGRTPSDGLAPIYNLFDRRGGGRNYSQRVSRRTCQDFRGGRLSYDEHDGTDFVCPVGTELVAPAPGRVVMIRDRWLRGGLTVAVDHGAGVVTHATHCAKSLVSLGQTVRRGEAIALSGAAGYDLVQFFPWVPPHIHFLVWRDGVPVDPFRRPDEADENGSWMERNEPKPVPALKDEPWKVDAGAIDPAALERASSACIDERIRAELGKVASDVHGWVALLEDALHHDRLAWPKDYVAPKLRTNSSGTVRLTLPLPAHSYQGSRFGDSPWTAPPAR
jgi:murein DD-endopeptidase MepM/ murein hydrolase activator NlpD